MSEWKKDNTKRMLGKKPHTCKICGAEGDFDTYLVREMMQGTRDEFVYFACDRCKCLQIENVPENLGDYYGSGYYSFQVNENPDMEFESPVTNMSKILDVGCGAGYWLLEKAKEGYGNLYGCDPFLEHDRKYGSRVIIRKCSIHEMDGDGTFDLIHMGNSFEHVTDPLEVLKSAKRLLRDGGILNMTIPTYPNIAFEKYGTNWYQLDAPRHIFLHSKESLNWLSKESGLALSGIRYNSNNNQFIRSYFYSHNITYNEQVPSMVYKHFSSNDIIRLQGEAQYWDEREYGDHMDVYWQKNSVCAEGNIRSVIYQVFPKSEGKIHHFPYPPIYRQADTDYICITDDKTVKSAYWDVRYVEELNKEAEETVLEPYALRWELKSGHIQLGPYSEASEHNVLLEGTRDTTDYRMILDAADKYRAKGDYAIAARLYAQTMALCVEIKDEDTGNQCFGKLMLCLYDTNDIKMFRWYKYLSPVYRLDINSQADMVWCMENLAYKLHMPANLILEYYNNFNRLCSEFSQSQTEDFGLKILDAWSLTIDSEDTYETQIKLLNDILDKISVVLVIKWVEYTKENPRLKIIARLINYAINLNDYEKCSVQELCFYAWILRINYPNMKYEEFGKQMFLSYVSIMGVFAERYYNAELLISMGNSTVPSDIRALYRIYVVLADAKANKENVALLKQALEICPDFHEEIRDVLGTLH